MNATILCLNLMQKHQHWQSVNEVLVENQTFKIASIACPQIHSQPSFPMPRGKQHVIRWTLKPKVLRLYFASRGSMSIFLFRVHKHPIPMHTKVQAFGLLEYLLKVPIPMHTKVQAFGLPEYLLKVPNHSMNKNIPNCNFFDVFFTSSTQANEGW